MEVTTTFRVFRRPITGKANCIKPAFKFTEAVCAICMDNVKNRAFVNSCSHTFCLACLLRWAKRKLECPLCKQFFTDIFYCVQSANVYKRIPLRNLVQPTDWRCSGEFGYNFSQLGRIQKLLEFGNMLSRDSETLPINTHECMRENGHYFRQLVYANNYWALAEMYPGAWLEPEYFVENTEAAVRLFPWIHRELECIPNVQEDQIDEIFDLIVSLFHIYEVYSVKVVHFLKPFLGDQTLHFLHELVHFIRSRKSMALHDATAVYSSVHFLHSNSIRGAVMNGTGEHSDFIAFDDTNKPMFHQELSNRTHVISLYPTVSYSDIIALTPDEHSSDRMYALDNIGYGCADMEQRSGQSQNDPGSAQFHQSNGNS